MSLLTALREGTIVVDGAMGTQLYERGVLYSACFEELNVSRPELVRKVHEDYVRAGAQVIETNTFGANALRLEKHGLAATRARAQRRGGAARARGRRRDGRTSSARSGRAGYFLGEALADGPRERVQSAFARAGATRSSTAGVDALVVETMRQTQRAARRDREPRSRPPGGKMPDHRVSVSVDERGRMADGTTAARDRARS